MNCSMEVRLQVLRSRIHTFKVEVVFLSSGIQPKILILPTFTK